MEILQTINEQVFRDNSMCEFLNEWVKAFDSSVSVKFADSRLEHPDQQPFLIIEEANDIQISLSRDITLWELPNLIIKIDEITQKMPGEYEPNTTTIRKLGEIFVNAALYIKEYSSQIDDSEILNSINSIIQNTYQYGKNLSTGEENSSNIIEEESLDEESKLVLDQWFLGDKAYNLRAKRGDFNNENIEQTRADLVKTYFKAHKKIGYISLDHISIQAGNLYQFQETTGNNLFKSIKTPETEFLFSIYRRGLKKSFCRT